MITNHKLRLPTIYYVWYVWRRDDGLIGASANNMPLDWSSDQGLAKPPAIFEQLGCFQTWFEAQDFIKEMRELAVVDKYVDSLVEKLEGDK